MRAAGAPYVVADLGPIGELMQPMGTLSFEEAYDLFAEQVDALLPPNATSSCWKRFPTYRKPAPRSWLQKSTPTCPFSLP